jgi:hypothetical protein
LIDSENGSELSGKFFRAGLAKIHSRFPVNIRGFEKKTREKTPQARPTKAEAGRSGAPKNGRATLGSI